MALTWKRVNDLWGADLWPRLDLALTFGLTLIMWAAGTFTKAGPVTITAMTGISLAPAMAAFYVRRHRDAFAAMGRRGCMLYIRALTLFVISLAALGIVGYTSVLLKI